MTLSAPKSVSLAALAGDERIVAAHDKAVLRTLAWIEANAAETRMRDPSTGTMVRAGGQDMVAATFRHDMSCNLDPQLHAHCRDRQHGPRRRWQMEEPSLRHMPRLRRPDNQVRDMVQEVGRSLAEVPFHCVSGEYPHGVKRGSVSFAGGLQTGEKRNRLLHVLGFNTRRQHCQGINGETDCFNGRHVRFLGEASACKKLSCLEFVVSVVRECPST